MTSLTPRRASPGAACKQMPGTTTVSGDLFRCSSLVPSIKVGLRRHPGGLVLKVLPRPVALERASICSSFYLKHRGDSQFPLGDFGMRLKCAIN